MTDFALKIAGHWKDGQSPILVLDIDLVVMVVSYDQNHHAYVIDESELSEFLDFVARVWEMDDYPQLTNEDSEDYLARIGVSVGAREWSWT